MEQREDPTAPARVATSPQADVDHEAAMPLILFLSSKVDIAWRGLQTIINIHVMEQHADPTAHARVATSPQADVDHEAALPLEDDLRIAKTTSAPRRVTLHQLSFREHSVQNLTALGRFDRLCLRFLKFVVARRALAFCMVTGFYVALAGAGIALGCLTPSPTYEYEWFIDKKRSTQNRDMRLAAVDAVDPLGAGDLHARKQPYTLLETFVEYAGPNDHIFTPERLQEIC